MSAIKTISMICAGVLMLFLAADAFAQGKGKGNFGGGNRGNSSANAGKKEDKSGLWDDQDKNKGKGDRPNTGKGRSSDDAGDNRYRGLSKKLDMPQDKVRSWYESERALNPDLNYGRFVAANMIARNRKGISADTILTGLRNGDSIGQTLHRSGWSDGRIKDERKRIKKMMKDDGYDDYQDRDIDWIFRR